MLLQYLNIYCTDSRLEFIFRTAFKFCDGVFKLQVCYLPDQFFTLHRDILKDAIGLFCLACVAGSGFGDWGEEGIWGIGERREKESLHAIPRFFDNRPQSLICERSYYFSQSALTGNEMLYLKLSNSRVSSYSKQ
jgi:hypothetical protein